LHTSWIKRPAQLSYSKLLQKRFAVASLSLKGLPSLRTRALLVQLHNLHTLQTSSSIDFRDHLIPLICDPTLPRAPNTVILCRILRKTTTSNNLSTCTTSQNEYGRRRSCSDVLQQLPIQQWIRYARIWICFTTSKWHQHQAPLI
jgi:hypothetical protein